MPVALRPVPMKQSHGAQVDGVWAASSCARLDGTSWACAELSRLVWRLFSPMSCSALLLLQPDFPLPALPRLERWTEEIQVADRQKRFVVAHLQRPLAAGIDDQASRDNGSRHPRQRPDRDWGRCSVRPNRSDLPVHLRPGSDPWRACGAGCDWLDPPPRVAWTGRPGTREGAVS